MPRIAIGIHLHAEPDRLRATLASLRANTAHSADLLLLPDGPAEATQAALAALPDLRDLPQLGTATPLGPPACFNRLAAASDAEVLVLLECGAQVGPGWLDYLLAALAADPHHGLAGPSTNRAWNEQCVFPHAFPHGCTTPGDVARTAREAARRFGATWRTLAPLHSLADFCYVVRREVVEAIGAADEGYGLGPCWEMDYNIRAARAGWRGVWACAAYVQRAPFTARRRREEALRFEAGRQRYQDKFCGLRLRGERAGFELHCRGEDCEHFAPADLIRLTLPLAAGSQPPASERPIQTPAPALISCIMPSCGRTAFVLQAIEYFQRQDYPARELIIVDDGPEELAPQLPGDPRIRYERLPPGRSIGAKRNRACELARGSLIAQWDDDDWYAPGRLSAQAAPLLAGEAELSGLTTGLFFDLARWEFWRCTPELHQRLFVQDVHGGTLVYQRRVWEQLARYPDRSLAEDAAFLSLAVRRGARLSRLSGESLFTYLRHAQNAWSFTCGQYLDPRGWQRVPEPPLPPADRAFYAARSPAAPVHSPAAPAEPPAPAPPRVSCIMPTADRRVFVPEAIRCFLRQDYPDRELIVIDDGRDPVADLIPPDPRVRYLRLDRRHTIGAKRNLACQAARGEIIVHWDDDDWMASRRLSCQVAGLLKANVDVCGLDRLLYYDVVSGQSWQYVYPAGGRPWVGGNTLCYTRAFWEGNPFPDVSVGEDNRFLWSGRRKSIVRLTDHTFYVALIHPGNASPKLTRQPCWQPYPTPEIRRLMGADWAFYAGLLPDQQPAVRAPGR
jgi:glycosyltransferase involved in cell wall biosynthesis/GT2 family glycosyltransferase